MAIDLDKGGPTNTPILRSFGPTLGAKYDYALGESILPVTVVGDGITDDAPAIQSAINLATKANGSCLIVLPNAAIAIASQLTITNSNIRLVGGGGDTPHNAGTNVTPSTTLLWIGPAGGTMVKFGTAYSSTASVIGGCGMENICLNGNNSAATGILIDTIRDCLWRWIYVRDVTGDAYKVISGVSGTNTAGVGESASCQGHLFERCHFRMIDAVGVRNANGFNLGGSTNANASYNTFLDCWGEYNNGAGFLLRNADNNKFIGCRSFGSGGTGHAFDLWAPGADGNGTTSGGTNGYFIGCGWDSFIIRGTEQGGGFGGSINNQFLSLDLDNSAPQPTLGTGVIIDGLWVDCTSTTSLTPGSGAFTSATVVKARYLKNLKLVRFYVYFTITTNGTAGTNIAINIPIPAVTVAGAINGVDTATGDWTGGYVDGTNSRVQLRNYAGAYSFISGSNVVVEGFYEAA